MLVVQEMIKRLRQVADSLEKMEENQIPTLFDLGNLSTEQLEIETANAYTTIDKDPERYELLRYTLVTRKTKDAYFKKDIEQLKNLWRKFYSDAPLTYLNFLGLTLDPMFNPSVNRELCRRNLRELLGIAKKRSKSKDEKSTK